MTGKPQFDEAAVVAAALEVFWRHGYAAASIQQLTQATGLSRSSLYQRFQDKDGLFREALAAYTARVLQRAGAAAVASTARGRLEALLREFLPKEGRAKRPPGCLLARSCAEMADLLPAGRALVLDGLGRQRAILVALLREATANGELPPDADVDALSWHFLGVSQSLLNLPQAGAKPEELRRVVDVAMTAWPLEKALKASKPAKR